MKYISLVLQLLLIVALNLQCKKPPTYTCDVDTGKTGYELAAAYDDCLVWNTQKTMTHTESEDIDIRATNLGFSEAASITEFLL